MSKSRHNEPLKKDKIPRAIQIGELGSPESGNFLTLLCAPKLINILGLLQSLVKSIQE